MRRHCRAVMVETSRVEPSATTAFTLALSSSGLNSLCCSWFEFQAKVFRNVTLDFFQKKKNIQTLKLEETSV